MGLPHQVTASAQKIRFILLDVDGVLTDGRVGLLPDGGEIKYFSIYDGLAIRLAQQWGIQVGFISGRESRVVEQRARELGVATVVQGSRDKVADFERILAEHGLRAEEIAYVGDDLPDIPLIQKVGFSAAPQNAAEAVKYYVHYITRAKGGDGAVREVIDLLLKSSGKWDEIIIALENSNTPAAG